MVEIRWSIDALDDLESIISYIEQDSPQKASDLVKGIFEKIEMLRDFPYLGRIFPDRNDEKIREIIYKKYRIIYEIKENTVEILIVAHGSKLIRF